MSAQSAVKNQTTSQPDANGAAGMTEAPYSVNFMVRHPDGFEMQFTLRAVDEADLMGRMEQLTSRLAELGYEPIRRNFRSDYKPASPAPSAEPPRTEGPTPPEPLFEDAWTGELTAGDAEPGTAAESASWCAIHNVEMARHERNGEVWYSHRAKGPNGEYWCKGKPARTAR